MRWLRVVSSVGALLLSVHPGCAHAQMVTPDDVRADLAHLLARLDSLHPDVSATMDRAAVERMATTIGSQLAAPMTRQAAWSVMARLNPLFGDGHTLVQFPDVATQLSIFVQNGGRILPDVFWIDAAQQLRLRRETLGTKAGARVLAINGVPAEQLVATLLARTHGDGPGFRRALASARFPVLYWLLYGGASAYRVSVDNGRRPRTLRMEGTDSLPLAVRPQVPFGQMFAQRLLPGAIGYLRVASFDGEQLEAFRAFTARAFAEFRDARVRDVIIDLRDNPGGDDTNWITGLAPYVMPKAFRTFGEARVRVTPENADSGDVIGSVQTVVGRRMYPSSADTPDRVPGTTYLLTGTSTYSAAMLLLTAAQDQNLAVIAGAPTGGRSCTTGRVRRVPLPRTGLVAYIPTVHFLRIAKSACADPVRPDLPIADDPFDPQRAVRILADSIRQRRGGLY